MWRYTVDLSKWGTSYGYTSPAAAQFECSEPQYYYYNYAVHLTINTRFGALGIL